MTEICESPSIAVERYLHQMRNIGALAAELGVSQNYIQAMKRHGFIMPGGKGSVSMARNFLENCPDFGVRESISKKPKN